MFDSILHYVKCAQPTIWFNEYIMYSICLIVLGCLSLWAARKVSKSQVNKSLVSLKWIVAPCIVVSLNKLSPTKTPNGRYSLFVCQMSHHQNVHNQESFLHKPRICWWYAHHSLTAWNIGMMDSQRSCHENISTYYQLVQKPTLGCLLCKWFLRSWQV